MAVSLPDPKQLVDSIADGAVEVLEGGSRLLEKEAGVVNSYAINLKSTAEALKQRTPDDPSVLIDTVIKTAGATLKAVVGGAEAFISAIDETAKGVKGQIDRVVR